MRYYINTNITVSVLANSKPSLVSPGGRADVAPLGLPVEAAPAVSVTVRAPVPSGRMVCVVSRSAQVLGRHSELAPSVHLFRVVVPRR